jgi:hypothetical protein
MDNLAPITWMTKEEMIDELISNARRHAGELSDKELREYVAAGRLARYTRQLQEEIGAAGDLPQTQFGLYP